MNWTAHPTTLSHAAGKSIRFNHARLRALIDEATFDSNDETDEHAGLLGMIREEVACPFWAHLQGKEVECVRFEWPKRGYGLNVLCRGQNGEPRRTVDIGSLEWTDPLPKGYEWIEAFFAWRKEVGA